MARCIVVSTVLLSVALVICTGISVHAGGKKSDSEVKVSATASKPDAGGRQMLTITLAHNKGWHTYANPVGNEDFESNKTIVTVYSKGKPVASNVAYPNGKVHKDKTVGDYKIYENKTEIQATIQRAPGDAGPLEVNVRVQACHEKGVCLLPATVKVTVP